MLASRVGDDACELANRWGLDATLAHRVVSMEGWAQTAFQGYWPGLYIISGLRTLEANRAAGGAPDSRHIRCPSMAVDLRVGTVVGVESGEVWSILGGWWKLRGGRWGGDFEWSGSPLPNPMEWNHFDLG